MPARYGRAAGRMLRRNLAEGSVTGISLILGCCAAVWFSAGTRTDDIRGALLLCGSYLAGLAARQLARTVPFTGVPSAAGPAALSDGFARPARACSAAAEYAVYAGLAAGGAADGWRGTWVLAVTALVLVAVRHTMGACWAALAAGYGQPAQPETAYPADEPGEPDRPPPLAAGPLGLSAGWRVLIVVVAAPVWGPRTALLGVVVGAIIAVGYAVGSRGPDVPAAWPEGTAGWPEGTAGWPEGTGGWHGPAGDGAPAVAGAAVTGDGGPAVAGDGGPAVAGDGGPAVAGDGGLAGYWRVIAACRDDGRFGGYLGRMVEGQLVPLPPALAGLAAAVMLAVLGLRGLPGVILLTPLVVMLLAAPGASHPHDGRFDWLVPAVLQAGQYIYLASLGSASGVPAAVTFGLCAVTAIWQSDLAFGRPRRTRLDIGLGWEGRMLFAGLGAAVGLPMLAYLALTAYLGVLACAEIRVSGSQVIGEDGRA